MLAYYLATRPDANPAPDAKQERTGNVIFEPSPKADALRQQVAAFMDRHIYPNEQLHHEQLHDSARGTWNVPPIMDALKVEAKAAGLWNLFLPDSQGGAGLTNLEYAPLAELMGRVDWASEVFNCSPPDTGNMEVLERYGTEAQKRRWLAPLLDGSIRSAFVMTEPAVASSDATNITTSILRDGDDYIINGRKWWITNAYHPRLGLFIVMGKTDATAPKHQQQTQILVDPKTPGITILRPLTVFGYLDQPKGHAEILFENARVPAENIILGEGRGFEIAQGRLGPGRIHHCMRIIGVAERLLEQLCKRLLTRFPFGKALADQSIWQQRLAEARTDVEMCRLLVLNAAAMMDRLGNKGARSEIAQIKVAVPRMGQRLCDMVIQAFGAAGVSDDFGLAFTYARLRVMRLGDGPDEVHNRTIARIELDKYRSG
jgi:acyl-CoA dehydrogenase